MYIPADLSHYVITFLNLQELQSLINSSIIFSQKQNSVIEFCITSYSKKYRNKLRIPWCRKRLSIHRELSPGPCCIVLCDKCRFTIFDLTGPGVETSVVAPYCTKCAATFANNLGFFQKTPVL